MLSFLLEFCHFRGVEFGRLTLYLSIFSCLCRSSLPYRWWLAKLREPWPYQAMSAESPLRVNSSSHEISFHWFCIFADNRFVTYMVTQAWKQLYQRAFNKETLIIIIYAATSVKVGKCRRGSLNESTSAARQKSGYGSQMEATMVYEAEQEASSREEENVW